MKLYWQTCSQSRRIDTFRGCLGRYIWAYIRVALEQALKEFEGERSKTYWSKVCFLLVWRSTYLGTFTSLANIPFTQTSFVIFPQNSILIYCLFGFFYGTASDHLFFGNSKKITTIFLDGRSYSCDFWIHHVSSLDFYFPRTFVRIGFELGVPTARANSL